MGGISTLSADARTVGSPPVAASSYKPENGLALLTFGGRHFTNFFSLQASYSRNSNDALLAGLNLNAKTSYEVPRNVRMQTLGLEAMAYFRARDNRLRPYLSAGPVVTWMNATPGTAPFRIHSTTAGVRVAVGMDLRVAPRIDLRYTFSETVQGNAISQALDPAGQRKLANFQNLWGVVFRF